MTVVSPRVMRSAIGTIVDAGLAMMLTQLHTLAQRGASPGQIRDASLELVPALVEEYGGATAVLAADWYDESRAAHPGLRRFLAQPVLNLGKDRLDVLQRAVIWGVDPLFDKAVPQTTALTGGTVDPIEATARRFSNFLGKNMTDPAHETIVDNVRRDTDAIGWKRQASSSACRFCRMLAARDVLYRRPSSRFASHLHCGCAVVPVFAGGEHGPEASVEQYRATQRNLTDVDRARTRAYLDDVYGPASIDSANRVR